ncbi:MAG: phosphate ABC transporter permease subunit PstC [Halobacteria archaeon]|nr:phosphate ABC transporter permease subunit PstC [Halobacteria archaeon]
MLDDVELTGKTQTDSTSGSRTGVVGLQILGAVSVMAAFVGFLLQASWTVYPLSVFVMSAAYGWYSYQKETARSLAFLTTVFTVLVLGLITVYLFLESIPVFRSMGIEIFIPFGKDITSPIAMWNPNKDYYSLAPMMWGTLITTLIAMAIAGPLGVAGALFIGEIAPRRVREVVKPGVEILAGIPSIVYGFIGYVIINEYMMQVFALPTFGSLFVVGVVIGIMALPTVVSVAEDAIDSIPESTKSGSLALGVTDWETMKSITIPAAVSGISAAVLLGVGRAIGETMAATVILGHSQVFPEPVYNIFGNTETLTSLIASQYGNAHGTHMKALFSAGVVLFVTVLVISVVSQMIEARMKQKFQGLQ